MAPAPEARLPGVMRRSEQSSSSSLVSRAMESRESARQVKHTLYWRLRKRWVIDPRVQHWLAYWDLMTASALVFTAIVTPVEVSFVESPKWADKWSNPLFLTNRAVDFVFIIDMALQFRVAYKSGGIHEGTRWHVAPSEIANHYVRSKWFYIDGFSILQLSPKHVPRAPSTSIRVSLR